MLRLLEVAQVGVFGFVECLRGRHRIVDTPSATADANASIELR
jgi:hypothetical protein